MPNYATCSANTAACPPNTNDERSNGGCSPTPSPQPHQPARSGPNTSRPHPNRNPPTSRSALPATTPDSPPKKASGTDADGPAAHDTPNPGHTFWPITPYDPTFWPITPTSSQPKPTGATPKEPQADGPGLSNETYVATHMRHMSRLITGWKNSVASLPWRANFGSDPANLLRWLRLRRDNRSVVSPWSPEHTMPARPAASCGLSGRTSTALP